MKHHHVIIGGTFDHFHLGHKKLIDKAFRLGRRITTGISKKSLFKNKLLALTIEDYTTRKKNIVEYLKKNNWQDKVKFKPIVNFFGTTLIDKTIDAIVVSKLTKRNALIINQERKKIGFPELKIIIVDDILACDGHLLTSEKIRMGEIDRKGNQYQISNIKYQKERLILPEEMREELRRPLGRVIKPKEFIKSLKFLKSRKIPMIISVGDIITMELLKNDVYPDVKIIDFRCRRKEIPIPNKFSILKKYKNKPGTINIKTADRLKRLIKNAAINKQKSWLVIDGEEDLMALPAILFAPLHSLVLYGQMDLGVVMVEVTEEVKNKVKSILNLFEIS